ncbi:MAG: hypothetical protein KDA45_01715 [Planctomycetales bacterium]|nr:hypothetical protein [Planctomycetales bacterium]
MNNAVQILFDELSFRQAPLSAVEPTAAPWTQDLGFVLPVHGTERQFRCGLPYYVRDLSPAHLGEAWPVFCGLLRRYGLPLFSSVADLQQVPAAAVPPRMGRRFVNEPLDAVELQAADGFELVCRDRHLPAWGWATEVVPEGAETADCELPALISAVRQAAGGDTPLGVGLPLGCQRRDLQRCLQAKVDFISLLATSANMELADAYHLVQTRRACLQEGLPGLPLLVAVPLDHGQQALKLLALGASAVCIDSLLRPLIPKAETQGAAALASGGGMLSSIAAAAARKPPTLPKVEALLQQLHTELAACLRQVGVHEPGELGLDCLQAFSPRTLRLIDPKTPHALPTPDRRA